jgi:hypothetical protein
MSKSNNQVGHSNPPFRRTYPNQSYAEKPQLTQNNDNTFKTSSYERSEIPRIPCTGCGRLGHNDTKCFKLHPELRDLRPNRKFETKDNKLDEAKSKPVSKKSAGMQMVEPTGIQRLNFNDDSLYEEGKQNQYFNELHSLGGNQIIALIDGNKSSLASINRLHQNIKTGLEVPALNPYTFGEVNDIPNTQIMRDTGSFTSVIREELVKPYQYTGRTVHVEVANGHVDIVQTALIPIKCRFIDGVVEMCVFKKCFTPCILGNHPLINSYFESGKTENIISHEKPETIFFQKISEGETDIKQTLVKDVIVRELNDVILTIDTNENINVPLVQNTDATPEDLYKQASDIVSSNENIAINAVTTRAKTIQKQNIKDNSVVNIVSFPIPDISPVEVAKLQKEDTTLANIWENLKETDNYKNYVIKNGFLYRNVARNRIGETEVVSQLVVPKQLRNTVLKISHESILGGHFSHKKTLDKIYACFTWPNCSKDTKCFTSSCDICQRTVKKGSCTRVLMQIGKLADRPFEHISCDLVGEIIPSSKAGHRWILTIIDNCTRYVEAIPLKKIDTISVYEALESFMLRMGFCETISTDGGSQFTSDLMEEILKKFKIMHIRCSPYNAKACGQIERFNQTFKKCLLRLCHERVQDWHLFIPPCLMAIRETTNSSTGFSSNELVFGRTLKGPMQILKQLMTKEEITPQVKTTYQYVLDLRDKIQSTCDLVKEELRKSQLKNKIYFDRRAKHRSLKIGDLVLLLLPLKENKMEMHWQGPFPVTKKVGLYDYQIKMASEKLKVFHINMLKLYNKRHEDTQQDVLPVAAIASVVEEEENSDDLMVDDSELLVHYNTRQKESYSDVEIDTGLSRAQTEEIKKLLYEFRDIFTDVPKITNLGEHEIILNSDEVIHCKPYPVPIHLRDKLDKELDSMLEAGIIVPSTGPFASPLVLVAKPDKSIRVCVNFKNLNNLSQFDPEPMVLVDDIFDKLGGNHFLSKFDMSKGYYALKLTDASKKYTTFTTANRGLYMFNVMPFGLSSAPASFTRVMRKLLGGTENLDFYLDDVLAHTDGWKAHVETLRVFFTRVRAANLALKPSKCKIGCTTIDFLGHRVVEDCKIPNPDNLGKIIEAARPETKKQIKSLLGSCGFYQSYIPRYSDIVTPLTDCLKKAMPNRVFWGEKQEHSFQLLKKAFLSGPVLKLVSIDKPFVLRTDASDVGVSAVLLQEHDGILHPVCFASKKLSDREKSYCISEREALGVVWGTAKFHKYLYGRPFVLETDHKPLTILKVSDSSSPRLQRWSLALQPFQFSVRHISGENCLISDWLSRHF